MTTEDIRYFGTIQKTETLLPTNIKGLENITLLESKSPFLGYYDDYPGLHNNVSYLYIVLNEQVPFVQLHHYLLKAKSKLDSNIDIVHASLHVNHENYTAIRLRGFNKMDEIKGIIDTIAASGIKLAGHLKKMERESSFTCITKYFKVENKSTGIWKDKTANHHAYIEVPQRYTQKEFTEILKRVRNNWTKHSFDAAMVILCSEKVSIEAIRIYSNQVWEEGYIEELQKLVLSNTK